MTYYTLYNYDDWSTKLFGIVTTNNPANTDPALDLQNREYTYSRAGDILQIKDNAKGITYDYAYDMLHRLVSEQLSGVNAPIVTKVETITLDYTGTGPVHGVKAIDLNGVSRTCAYDLNGNMVTSPDFTTATNPLNRTITYDADNMPTRIVHANGKTVDFVYDGVAKRTKKLVQSGKTVLYLGDHFEVENGVNIKYIFGGNLRLAQIKGSLTSYFHKDHLGSTAAVTDEAGVKVESTTYEPFGSTRTQEGTVVSAYKFTDQELDNETNLYNYDARLYDPVLGMFVTPDSIVPDMFDPQSLNRYTYCRNNPLIYVDPSGHGDVIGGSVPSNGCSDDPDYKGHIASIAELDKACKESSAAYKRALIEYKKSINCWKKGMVNNLVYNYGQVPIDQLKEMMKNYDKWDTIADILGLIGGKITNVAAALQTLWDIDRQWQQKGASTTFGIEGSVVALGGCGGTIGSAFNTGWGESVIDFGSFISTQGSVGYTTTLAGFIGRSIGDVTNLTGMTVNASFGYGVIGGTISFSLDTGDLVGYQVDFGYVGLTGTLSMQATGSLSCRQVLNWIF